MVVSLDNLAPLELLRGEIQAGVAQTKFGAYPLLNLIRKQSAFQTSIDWPVNVGGAAVYGRATTTNPNSTNSQEANVGASLDIGSRVIEHKFSININQATQALRTAPQQLRNLYSGKVMAGIDAMMVELERLAFAGTGVAGDHGVIGLNKVVEATYAYAGIDPVVNPGWSSHLETNGTDRALTTALMRKTATGMGKKGANYNYVVTSFEGADKLEELFESRLAVSQVGGTTDIGFTGVNYQGRPVVKSPYATAKSIYFLDTNDIILHTFSPQSGMELMDGSGASIVVPVEGINVLLTRMPVSNPYTVDFLMGIQAQVQVFNRRSVALLNAVTF